MGKITYKKTETGTKLYLHVFNWPLNKQLYLTGIKTKPEKVYFLADKQQSELKFIHSEALTTIQLTEIQPDPYVSVIVVEYKNEPLIVDGLVSKSVSGGFSLHPQNQMQFTEPPVIINKERGGTVPEHAVVKKNETFRWRIYVDEPGEKRMDVSYSYQQNSNNSKLTIKASNTELIHKISNTGKTVGEPNENWIIDNYKSNDCGKINFPEKGFYTIELEISPAKNEEIKFQWLWIK